MGDVKYHGGFADVLKCECGDRTVAVKALRQHDGVSLEDMTNGFCKEVVSWKSLQHQNVLPLLGAIMTGGQFAMVSEWMTNGNIKEFIAARRDANRFELLAGAARGLEHLHSRGMIHGDLKGANIVIDRTGHACLADFGLLTIASDATNITSANSFPKGGSYQWMGPELFDPEKFNLKDRRPTKSSDRYAFGMVIYEVLSGKIPFLLCHRYAVAAKVLEGGRPARPEGVEGSLFTDVIWSILESCWKASPDDRPKVKAVLHCLEEVSSTWTPPQITADSPTVTPTTHNVESSSEGTTDEDESSASQLFLPQPESRLRLEGDPTKYRINPPAYNDSPDQPMLGTPTNNHSESKESGRILDRVSPAGLFYSIVLTAR
ncbi:kinase-like domain-containing protein [Thelephora terrestris]|uniref:Kinase-like domain-containing protein n=1 Tax=Thelephora terrestris TaxID=56493 RepID=A0A9P6H2N1_9AGAM|nr:kinase-like domain-containing protein [Thelephora terrestris]